MNDDNKRTAILVLGMHRSGTSALTRVLSLMGAALPRQMLGPGEGNERGHWEPERLVKLNDTLLSEAGTSWHNWQSPDIETLGSTRLVKFRHDLRELVEQDYDTGEIFVIKDPRISLLLPLYAAALSDMGVQPVVVVSFRNPLEVAASLEMRNQFSRVKSSLMWVRYLASAELYSRELPRAFVSFSSLLRDCHATIDRLCQTTQISWSRQYEDVAPDIDAFLSSELRHHRAEDQDLAREPATKTWAGELFRSLQSLEQDAQAPEALAAFERVRRELKGAEPLLVSEEKISNQAAEALHTQNLKCQSLEKELAGAVRTAHSHLGTVEELRAGAQQYEHRLEKASETIGMLHVEVEQHQTKLGRANETIGLLEAGLAEKAAEKKKLEGAFLEAQISLENEEKSHVLVREQLADEKKSTEAAVWALTHLIAAQRNEKMAVNGRKNSPLLALFGNLFRGALTTITGREHHKCLYTLSPQKHLRAAHPADSGWVSTGNDPIFHLVEMSDRHPSGWVKISIGKMSKATDGLRPRLYFDDGTGFSEQNVIPLPTANEGRINAIIQLPEHTALRLDPTEGEISFALDGVIIEPLTKFGAGWRFGRKMFQRHRRAGHSLVSMVGRALVILRKEGWRSFKERLVRLNTSPQAGISYSQWLATRAQDEAMHLAHAREAIGGLSYRPVFSIVMPTYNTPKKWLIKALDSVVGQIYPDWELCISDDASTEPHVREILQAYADKDSRIKVTFRDSNGHISRATNDAMKMMTGEYMCLMDHDDEIAPNALYEFADLLNKDSEIDFIYSDEDKLTVEGERYEPFFKPDWSPTLLESCMYTAHFACYRNEIVRKVGGFRPECNGAQDYDFVLRFTEHVQKVKHVPRVLYHWRAIPGSTAQTMDNKAYVIDAALRALSDRCARTGKPEVVKSASYAGSFAVRRALVGSPKISIVIPSAGRDSVVRGQNVDLLVNCISSIESKSSYKNFEIIVVDNGDLRTSTIDALAQFEINFVSYTEPKFNVATKMNMGAELARGDYVMFLNDDIEVISNDWLEAMLAAAQLPGVGAVGAKLYFEDGLIQHVGVTSNNGWPDHMRRGFPSDDPGYFFSSVTTREVSAVTGACVLMPRGIFEEIGGFNEDFAINYNDIDLCVRIREKGLRILQSSQAELFHYESRNRERSVDDKELALWEKLHRERFMHDPYYSPILTVSPPTFEPDFTNRGSLI